MAELNAEPAWEPPVLNQSLWEDMLNDLLREPVSEVGEGAEVQTLDDGLLGVVGLEDVIGLGDGPDSGAWWAAAPVDHVLEDGDGLRVDETFLVDENVSLPGLSSEVSSLAGRDLSGREDSLDSLEKGQELGVSSPGSCSRVDLDCVPSSSSGHEAGNVSSRSHSPILTSCSDQGAASPDAGCDSSDVGAMGRSCDNFCGQPEGFGDKASGEMDEDTKRQSRLMRNRESATQSRQRKKAYIKEMEAKCRAMESQMSMLHQTVAFTSAQNAALREELAHYRCLKGNGSKSGAMEPAALPSDSLPSESPSRRTTPYLSVRLELVAFLCHVLLLTHLQAPPLKPARSGGRIPSEARSERREPCFTASWIERFSEVANQLRKRQCSSKRGRRRVFSFRDNNFLRPRKSALSPGSLKRRHTFGRTSTKCRTSGKRSLKRLSRRSQYRYLSLK